MSFLSKVRLKSSTNVSSWGPPYNALSFFVSGVYVGERNPVQIRVSTLLRLAFLLSLMYVLSEFAAGVEIGRLP